VAVDLVTLAQAVLAGVFVGAIYSLVSAGLTLIWGTMRIVNFAHGSLMMLGMYMAYWTWLYTSLDPLLSSFLIFPTFFVLGYAIDKFLLRKIVQADAIAQLLITFGLALFIQNVVLYFWRSDIRIVNTSYSSLYWHLGAFVFDAPHVVVFAAAILCGLGLHLFLTRSSIGLAIRATAQDREAAQTIGIETRRIFGLTFGLGTALAAVAGAFVTSYYPVSPDAGNQFLFLAFVVVVLGSLGNYLGALIGGLIIGVVQSTTGYLFIAQAELPLAFLVFLIILVFKPEGMFGRRLRR
jgi:branched-chain amino acid transport system permease protein